MTEEKLVINGTFILALLGALSWLPQIISWIHSLLAKPKLRFVPEDTTEIGYSSFGPILNQSFAISTSKKDALIEKVTLTLIHESGAKHDLSWRILDERGPEITSPTGSWAEVRKNQPAIALKISILGLTEKKIGFQDLNYQMKFLPYLSGYQRKDSYLQNTEGPNYAEKLIKSQEFLDVTDYIKKGFYWIEGKYDAILSVYESSRRKPHVENYEFELNKIDIEQLEKNIQVTQDKWKDSVFYKGKDFKEWPVRIWNWINPAFHRTTK